MHDLGSSQPTHVTDLRVLRSGQGRQGPRRERTFGQWLARHETHFDRHAHRLSPPRLPSCSSSAPEGEREGALFTNPHDNALEGEQEWNCDRRIHAECIAPRATEIPKIVSIGVPRSLVRPSAGGHIVSAGFLIGYTTLIMGFRRACLLYPAGNCTRWRASDIGHSYDHGPGSDIYSRRLLNSDDGETRRQVT